MSERLENSEETTFYNWCKNKFIPCYKLVCLGRRGFPDRTVFLSRVVLFFEFKKKGNKPSPHQMAFRTILQQLGFRVEVVYTAQKAIEIVEEYL